MPIADDKQRWILSRRKTNQGGVSKCSSRSWRKDLGKGALRVSIHCTRYIIKERRFQAFTDGSLLNDHVGFGAFIELPNLEEAHVVERIPDGCTVFQAEQKATQFTASWLEKHLRISEAPSSDVHFYVDSQAAILALDKRKTRSALSRRTIQSLNALAKHNTVTIHWVKAHVGHLGNEFAGRR